MTRVCKIVLICEGWRDSAFARGFLDAAGVGRSVEPKVNPGGCGHDWVKMQFVEEVANLMRFSEGRGVLALLDEDGQGVANRTREVSGALAARSLPRAATASEGRCLLLPARNIETWLYWLIAQQNGIRVSMDEVIDYKINGPPTGCARLKNEQCRPAGEYLHSLNHIQMPNGFPPLLGQALALLREFLRAVRR